MILYVAYILLGFVGLLLIGVVLLQDNRAGGLQAMTGATEGGLSGKSTNTEISKLTMILSIVFAALLIFVGVQNVVTEGSSIIDVNDPSISAGAPANGDASDANGARDAAGDGAGSDTSDDASGN